MDIYPNLLTLCSISFSILLLLPAAISALKAAEHWAARPMVGRFEEAFASYIGVNIPRDAISLHRATIQAEGVKRSEPSRTLMARGGSLGKS